MIHAMNKPLTLTTPLSNATVHVLVVCYNDPPNEQTFNSNCTIIKCYCPSMPSGAMNTQLAFLFMS
jgi:hypothetical protein